MMMKITEDVARKNRYLALYTGESVAQVASQTLENIQATNDAISMSVLRPLIGFDKAEIIEIAKKIDTYETSILPHEDCCTRFVPKHPETKADLEKVRSAEENLNVEKLTQEAIQEMEIKNIK
jgi:tRNA uracil 4-sulfurtransferase